MIGENRYLEQAMKNLDRLRSIRRDLHQHPELGMHETRTAKLIAEHLGNLGMEVQTGVGGTGVVGILYGREKDKTVALRADIDALPMQDLKKVSYASKNAGVAHSCGHDAHTAILLGAADILSSVAEELPGAVKFIFQPSEDTLPGGALPMIEDGALDNPKVDAIFSLHLGSDFPEGKVMVKSENVSTSSMSFSLIITGRGGHVGSPHDVINPLLLAGSVITTCETLLPKRVEPGDVLIFDFGSIHGGTVSNIIPDEVTLQGSIRTSSPDKRDEMVNLFESLARGIVESGGGSMKLELTPGYPTIYNDAKLVELFHQAAIRVVGTNGVTRYDKIITGGDDAAFFQQKVPGVYWFLGIRNEKEGYIHPLHSPYFDFNEEVLAVGSAVQTQAAVDYLKSDLFS